MLIRGLPLSRCVWLASGPMPFSRVRPVMTTNKKSAEAQASPGQDYASALARIQQKKAVVGIIGLGYVGLPLARAFTTGGYTVLGFDVDSAKIEKLGRGESYIGHIG